MDKKKLKGFVKDLTLDEVDCLLDMLAKRSHGIYEKINEVFDVYFDAFENLDRVRSGVERFKRDALKLGEEYRTMYELNQSLKKMISELKEKDGHEGED